MSEMQTFSASKRDALGKGPNRRLRVESIIPGIYYRPDGTNISVQMPALPLEKLYKKVGRSNVFNLEIDDNGVKSLYPVFIWDAQYHPVKSHFTHMDFYGVDLNKELEIKVRLNFSGTAKGVKAGGKQEEYREEVILSAKPQDMPRFIDVDVSDMEIGSTLRASSLKLPNGVKVVFKNDYNILAILATDKEKKTEESETF